MLCTGNPSASANGNNGDAGRLPPSVRLSGVEPVALRPLTFGEVLDTSFNLFRRNFKSAVTVAAVIMVPLTLIGAVAAAGLAPTNLAVLNDPNVTPEDVLSVMGGFLGALGIGALLQLFGAILVQAATTRIYSENYRGIKVAPGEALRHGLSRVWAMLGLTLLTSIGTFIALLACLLPGIWLWAAWGLAPAGLIAEKAGPITSLRRSFRLVRGSWWRIFGILLLTTVMVAVITSIVTAPLQLAFTFGSGFADSPDAVLSPTFLVANTLISGLATALTLPFTAAVVVAVYYDQRVRKEGYDLERLIADLGERPSAPAESSTDQNDPFGLG